jgi:hypothetical protein
MAGILQFGLFLDTVKPLGQQKVDIIHIKFFHTVAIASCTLNLAVMLE